jgi:hypothetical protein
VAFEMLVVVVWAVGLALFSSLLLKTLWAGCVFGHRGFILSYEMEPGRCLPVNLKKQHQCRSAVIYVAAFCPSIWWAQWSPRDYSEYDSGSHLSRC